MNIDQIKTAGRRRKDLGDLRSLADSMQRVGLLHPVVVTADHALVAGARRIAAARLLGWQDIPHVVAVGVDDALKLLLAERDENSERKGFTPEEAVDVATALEPMEREAARKRQLAGVPLGNLPEGDRGRVLDKVSAAVSMGRRTLEKAKTVVEAARETPERFGPVLEEMNRTGRVDRAVRQLREKQREADREEGEVIAAQPLPDRLTLLHTSIEELGCHVERGSVDVIITDPPYPADALKCYSGLSLFAAYALKPGGSLLAMAGQSHLPEVVARLSRSMRYHWTLSYGTPGGQSAQVWPRKVNTFWKPVLWFTNGEYVGDWHGDVLQSDVNDNDKRFHEWGQSESGIGRLVEGWSKPGETVCDPFVGGGTVAAVALRLGRSVIAADSDPDAIETTRKRLAGGAP